MAIIFYAHILSPFNFQSDIKSHFEKLWKSGIEFPLARMRSTNTDGASEGAWRQEYPDISYQAIEFTNTGDQAFITTENVMDVHGYKCNSKSCKDKGTHIIQMSKWSQYRTRRAVLECPSCKLVLMGKIYARPPSVLPESRVAFGFPIFNVWDSPQRQFGKSGFVDRVLALTESQSPPKQAVSRYLKFLQLMKQGKSILVPTLDIDLLWHTHQLSPIAYHKYCKKHVSRRINHDDTIQSGNRSTGEDNTALLWAMRYGESYFDPENAAKTAEIQQRKATYMKKKEDKETKLAASKDKEMGLKTKVDEAKHHLELDLTNRRAAEMASDTLSKEVWFAKAAESSAKPALRLFKLRYYRQPHRQQQRQLQDKRRSLTEEHLVKQREFMALAEEANKTQLETNRLRDAWHAAQAETKNLELLLTAEVTLATAAICQFGVDRAGILRRFRPNREQDQFHEDRYDGSWCSIVPSEVQPCCHPVEAVRPAAHTRSSANKLRSKTGYKGSRDVSGGGGGGYYGGFGGGYTAGYAAGLGGGFGYGYGDGCGDGGSSGGGGCGGGGCGGGGGGGGGGSGGGGGGGGCGGGGGGCGGGGGGCGGGG